MPAPAAAWTLVRVYGTWNNMDGSLKRGTYTISMPARTTDTPSDVIVPGGIFATGLLQTSNAGAPSLDVMVPATDDPSVAQTGLTVTITVTFTDYSTPETYVITVPYANRPVASGGNGNGVDLRTIALPQNLPTSTPAYKIGVAGGLAQLNSAGQVIDADGSIAGAVVSVNGKIGAVTLAASDVSALPLTAADFKPETYGAKGDGKVITDAAITTGTAVLTSPSGGFSGAVVGQYVYVASAGGFANVPLVTTIASVQSSTQVTLAANASATVSGKGCIWGTDDTAALQSAINAATTYGQTHGGATIRFSDAIYCVAGAPGGTNMKAQLQLPNIAPTTAPRKVHLTFKGARDATSYIHWDEPNPPSEGSVLFSMYYNDAAQTTAPPPVVVGGPVTGYGQNNGLFSNMRVDWDGVNILAAHRSCMSGLDLFGVAQANIKSFSYHTCSQAGSATGTVWPVMRQMTSANPSAWKTFGYRTPTVGNNALNVAGVITVYNAYYGVVFADHFNAQAVGVIGANSAIVAAANSPAHYAFIGTLVSEDTDIPVLCDITGDYGYGQPQAIFIAALGSEDATTLVSDPSNYLRGEIHLEQLNLTPPFGGTNGAKNVRVIYDGQVRGPVGTPPAIPASGTALANGYFRDATGVISGGTVTGIAIDGVTQGVTSGPVTLPTGSSITLTYSVAPTWAWSLR